MKASTGVVLVNESLYQHHPGASRHPSSAEEGSLRAPLFVRLRLPQLVVNAVAQSIQNGPPRDFFERAKDTRESGKQPPHDRQHRAGCFFDRASVSDDLPDFMG